MIKFGDKVTFERKMFRAHQNDPTRRSKPTWLWRPVEFGNSGGTGVFLGYRSLQQGYRDYGSDEGHYFVETGMRVKVALVCTGPSSNPIYVDTTDLEVAK